MNCRNTASRHEIRLDENGILLCPMDGAQLKFPSVCGGKNRASRLKFICPKTERVKSPNGMTWRCRCDQPCSASTYGRCVYIYPNADLFLAGIVQLLYVLLANALSQRQLFRCIRRLAA